ncbi:MAG: pilus assembly protein TadG-related protein [Candidatus Methylacidiphilales bacterium]
MNMPSFKSFLPLSCSITERKRKKGQVFVIFSIFLFTLIVGFFALAMDFALIYHTKAMLQRTVDAVALRLVNKFSMNHTETDRQRIAQSIFEANFNLIKSGENLTWGWTTDGNSITSSTGETATGNAVDDTGKIKYKLVIHTKADNDTGVIVTNVKGTAEHDTLLLPIFSPDYETFDFTEEAQADRFPSVNAIIIDTSGSMNGNQGALGIRGTSGVKGAVEQFVEEFDELRDYMLLVTFSNQGKVVWPPTPEGTDSESGLPYFKPSRRFLTGVDILPDSRGYKTIPDVVNNTVSFSGWTNGADGLRVAAQNVQLWLNNEPSMQDATVRSKVRVNYIFMTDGENNAYRTYVRGYGYGRQSNGNYDNTPPILSVHNTFHREWPLIIRDQADLVGLIYKSRNLGTLLNSAVASGQTVHPENVPGIVAGVNSNRINNNNNRFVRTRVNDSINFENWSGVLLKETDSGAAVNVFSSNYDARVAEVLNFSATVKTVNDANDQGLDHKEYVLDTDKVRERGRLSASYQLTLPRTVSHSTKHDFLNPGLGHNYYNAPGSASNPTSLSVLNAETQTETEPSLGWNYHYITRGTTKRYYFLSENIYLAYKNRYDNVTNSDVRMTNVRANYFPLGEVYANHQGSFVQNNGNHLFSPKPATSHHHYHITDGGKRRDFISQRISDFYPRYHFDGPPKQSRWRGVADDNTNSQSSGSYYRFSNGGGWNNNLSAGGECNFLATAQAKILRKRSQNNPFIYQDATIYAIRYTGGNVTMLKSVSNDSTAKTGDFVAFPTENEGGYYDVTQGSTNLQAAFKNIASRIAVRISR